MSVGTIGFPSPAVPTPARQTMEARPEDPAHYEDVQMSDGGKKKQNQGKTRTQMKSDCCDTHGNCRPSNLQF